MDNNHCNVVELSSKDCGGAAATSCQFRSKNGDPDLCFYIDFDSEKNDLLLHRDRDLNAAAYLVSADLL